MTRSPGLAFPVLLALLASAPLALAQMAPGMGAAGPAAAGSGAAGPGMMGGGTMGGGTMGGGTMGGAAGSGAMPAPMAPAAAPPSLSVMGAPGVAGTVTAPGAATQPGPLSTTAATVPANPDGAGALVSDHGLIYETTTAGAATQGFVTIENQGHSTDTLTALTCPIADTTTLVGADGKIESDVSIAPGKPLPLSAKGPHLALKSTHLAIYPGSTIPCALTFRNAGPIQIMLYATKAP